MIFSTSRQSSARPPGQYLARPVRPLHAGDQPRQLLGFLGVRRRRHRQRILQHDQLAAVGGRQVQRIEPRRLPRVPRLRVDQGLVRFRGHLLGVGSDIGRLGPPRTARRVAEPQQLPVGLVQERPHTLHGRRVSRRGPGVLRVERQRRSDEGEGDGKMERHAHDCDLTDPGPMPRSARRASAASHSSPRSPKHRSRSSTSESPSHRMFQRK